MRKGGEKVRKIISVAWHSEIHGAMGKDAPKTYAHAVCDPRHGLGSRHYGHRLSCRLLVTRILDRRQYLWKLKVLEVASWRLTAALGGAHGSVALGHDFFSSRHFGASAIGTQSCRQVKSSVTVTVTNIARATGTCHHASFLHVPSLAGFTEISVNTRPHGLTEPHTSHLNGPSSHEDGAPLSDRAAA